MDTSVESMKRYFVLVKIIDGNRLFYSCVLSVLAWIESEAGVDLVLIETSLLFLCK